MGEINVFTTPNYKQPSLNRHRGNPKVRNSTRRPSHVIRPRCVEACQEFSENCQQTNMPECLTTPLSANGTSSTCSTAPASVSLVSALANPCTPRSHLSGTSEKQPKVGSGGSVTDATLSSESDSSGDSYGTLDRPGLYHVRRLPQANSAACDMVVQVGLEEFYYPSTILEKPEYLQKFLGGQISNDGRLHLSFPNHQASDWLTVVEFLQPTRNLGRATQVSWQNLPVVLPWFAELGLKAQLKEVDLFMLETVVVGLDNNTDEDTLAISVANLLLLAEIAFQTGLVLTQSQSQQWLQDKLTNLRYLQRSEESDPPLDDDVELEWSLPDLQQLCLLLSKSDDLRMALWESCIIMYLPHDLDIEDSKALLCNPLFPYLLREGMVQLSLDQALPKANLETPEIQRTISPSLTSSSATTMPTSHLVTMKKERLTQDLVHVLLQTAKESIDLFRERNTAPAVSPVAVNLKKSKQDGASFSKAPSVAMSKPKKRFEC